MAGGAECIRQDQGCIARAWQQGFDFVKLLPDPGWKFNHFGPYVDDVINLAKADPRFVVLADKNVYGRRKDRIALRSAFQPETLTPEDRAALDHVIEKTRRLSWEEFIRLIYSTYPVLVSERHSELDLVRLAGKYRQESFAG